MVLWVTNGFYDEVLFAPAANATLCYSDFIAVVPGQQYVANASMVRVAYYGPGKVKLRTGISTFSTSFTPPAGVYFVRVTVTIAGAAAFQLEAGSSATAYQAYRYEAQQETGEGVPIVYPTGEDLDPAPEPVRPSHYGLERLRETRQRLRSLALGKAGLTARLTIAHIGDSWTYLNTQYALKVAAALWGKYHPGSAHLAVGPIGFGWCSFARVENSATALGSTISTTLAKTVSGTWTSTIANGGGPDTGQAIGETGATLRLDAVLDYTRDLAYTLLAEGGAGSIEHSWDGGATWQAATDLSALSSGLKTVALGGKPTGGTGELRLRVSSGPATLYGVIEASATAAGIVSHKLGASGTTSYQWSVVNATLWQAGITALAPDLVTIMFGTNDQVWMSAAQHKTAISTLVSRVRAARPTADILLVAPCENQRTTNAIPMSDYAAMLSEIAQEQDVAYLDLQPFFGADPDDYASGSARPWFNADLIHPLPDFGGYAIADALLWAMGER